jgi:hypothetical protein
LPNLKELRSLVEECRFNPSINDTVFSSHIEFLLLVGFALRQRFGRRVGRQFRLRRCLRRLPRQQRRGAAGARWTVF